MHTTESFLGHSRGLLVDGLVSLYEGVIENSEPCLVSLEAPAGWGKSRIACEFYSRLQAHQKDPKFWPPMPCDPDGKHDAVLPSYFERPPNAIPEFFWWGISCLDQNDDPTTNLRNHLEHFDSHKEGIRDAHNAIVSTTPRWKHRTKQVIKSVTTASRPELISKGAEFIAGAYVPLVNIGADLIKMGVKAHKDRKKDRERKDNPAIVGLPPQPAMIETTVSLLDNIARSTLPIIVCIEDIDQADDMLLSVIEGLLQTSAAILIVSTASTDRIDENERLVSLFENVGGIRSYRLSMNHIQHGKNYYIDSAPEPFHSEASLAQLEDEILRQIALDLVPELASDELLDAFMADKNNPRIIEKACELLKKKLDSGPVSLTPEYLRKHLPTEIADIYDELWTHIPKPTRVALAVAHMITPKTIVADGGEPETIADELAALDDSWTHDVLRDVVKRIGLRDRDTILDQLDKAPNAYAWIRIIDDHLRSFLDPVQREIVGEKRTRLVKSEIMESSDSLVIADARTEILNQLSSILERGHHDTEYATANRARMILALHNEGFIKKPTVVANAIDTLLHDTEDEPGQLSERIRLYEYFLMRLQHHHPQIPVRIRVSIRHLGCIALSQASRIDEAINGIQPLLTELLDKSDTSLSAEGRLKYSVAAYNNWLVWLDTHRSISNYYEAVQEFSDMVDESIKWWGKQDPIVLHLRANLIGLRLKAQVSTSSTPEEFASVLDEAQELKDDAVQTAITEKSNTAALVVARYAKFLVALAYNNIGDIDTAIRELEPLRRECSEDLGPEHQLMIMLHMTLAQCYASSNLEKSIEYYEEAIEGRRSSLGSDHANTLRTRFELAVTILSKGYDTRDLDLLTRSAEMLIELQHDVGGEHGGGSLWTTQVWGQTMELGECVLAALATIRELNSGNPDS